MHKTYMMLKSIGKSRGYTHATQKTDPIRQNDNLFAPESQADTEYVAAGLLLCNSSDSNQCDCIYTPYHRQQPFC
jgi:hypothetical protein